MTKSFRYPVEFTALIGLILVLPSFEAPKNLLWLLFVVIWLYNRFSSRRFGGRWDIWDSLIVLWLCSGYVVAAFAGLHGSEWRGADDIVRYASLLWLLKRSGYGTREFRWLIVAMTVSTAAALAWGLWSLFVIHTRTALELNSVGHVNHSAIYLGVSFSALLAFTLAYWRQLSLLWRGVLIVTLLAFSAGLLISSSRAAVGMTFVVAVVMGIAWMRRTKIPVVALATLSLVIAVGAYVAQVSVVKKQEDMVKEDNVLTGRLPIWNTAIEAWRTFPVFGVGMDNFKYITAPDLKKWLARHGKVYSPEEYRTYSHGHSLYLNTLAERGVFGMAVLGAVLLYWLYFLWRKYPPAGADNMEWALWGGSLGAWIMHVGIGAVNTTLHHEHAMLAMLILGAWLGYLRSAQRGGTQ